MIATIDQKRRLQIPEEWASEFAPKVEVELEHCDEGLLVKPLRKSPLRAALEHKVSMQQPVCLDLSELDMDLLGW